MFRPSAPTSLANRTILSSSDTTTIGLCTAFSATAAISTSAFVFENNCRYRRSSAYYFLDRISLYRGLKRHRASSLELITYVVNHSGIGRELSFQGAGYLHECRGSYIPRHRDFRALLTLSGLLPVISTMDGRRDRKRNI